MNAAQKVKGRPTLGGPDDRLSTLSILPQVRRVVRVEADCSTWAYDEVWLQSIEWPPSLRLPTVVVVDLKDAKRVEDFTRSTVEFVAHELLRRAAASVLDCRPQDVDPTDLDTEQLRDAWSLLHRTTLQFEGTHPRAVEAVADALEAALLDLADELGVG